MREFQRSRPPASSAVSEPNEERDDGAGVDMLLQNVSKSEYVR